MYLGWKKNGCVKSSLAFHLLVHTQADNCFLLLSCVEPALSVLKSGNLDAPIQKVMRLIVRCGVVCCLKRGRAEK